ncbi:calmodulin-like protein 6 [Fukomys damarensis]|uniref:calmodulin-like protein 6 n=1 Tax=Fukomys damarensis TaxID=885580 RepID=UPI00145590FB|nr:calmodulin-like protein 6 [Fukomys damarensis]
MEKGCASPQIDQEYKGISEMFIEESNEDGELESLTSLLGMSSTKSELVSIAKVMHRQQGGWPRWGQPQVGLCVCSGLLPLRASQTEAGIRESAHRYLLMSAGDPLSQVEAGQTMKEADKDRDQTIAFRECAASREHAVGWNRVTTCFSAHGVRGHDDPRVLQAGSVGTAATATGRRAGKAATVLPTGSTGGK